MYEREYEPKRIEDDKFSAADLINGLRGALRAGIGGAILISLPIVYLRYDAIVAWLRSVF